MLMSMMGEEKEEDFEIEMLAKKLIEIEKLKKDKTKYRKVWSKAAKMLKDKEKENKLGVSALQSVKPTRL